MQSLTAAAAIPALPALPATAPTSVPNAARFWAIYMTSLHGDVTPAMLSQMTGLPARTTQAIRTKLVADKVIKPIGFLRKSLSTGLSENNVQNVRQAADTIMNARDMDHAAPNTEGAFGARVGGSDNPVPSCGDHEGRDTGDKSPAAHPSVEKTGLAPA